LANYGTGAVMAVPAHDERDFAFAKKYNLPIKTVVSPFCHPERLAKDLLNVIILHGRQKMEQPEKPPQNVRHWLGWLKDELEKSGIKTTNPLISRDWEVSYVEWKKEFEKNEVNENTILVGTSDGGAFLVRWLGEAKKKIKKLILVAPAKFVEDDNKNKIEFYNFEIDKKISERCEEIIIYISNDEPRMIKSAELYASELKAKLITLENRGHFTVRANPENNKFPELLEEIDPSRGAQDDKKGDEAFCENGININSDFLNGLKTIEAKNKIVEWLEKEGKGKKKVNYKLNDWVFSRQRYWGEPIPMVHCPSCGTVPVAEKDLPVVLPEVEHYEPTGTGESPLANIADWVNTTCPKCGGPAKRETNTMPQWAGSSWYYLRYIDPYNSEALVDKEKEKYWSPVDFYVGGAEHATRHLIYARFWHKFLFDIGAVNYDEPFTRLQHVGLIMAEDGRKMSKRWGNVINPDDIIEQYGADALRVYEMFMGPFGQSCAWNTNGLVGARKFLDRVWALAENSPLSRGVDAPRGRGVFLDESTKEIKSLLHKTIKKVSEDIAEFKFNTCISSLMILSNALEEYCRNAKSCVPTEVLAPFVQILAPFAPHLAEEIWREKLGNKHSIFSSNPPRPRGADTPPEEGTTGFTAWPKFDPELIKDETVNLVVQINGKLRATISVPAEISQDEAMNLARENDNVKKWLEGKEITKIIFVPGKLLNIVIK